METKIIQRVKGFIIDEINNLHEHEKCTSGSMARDERVAVAETVLALFKIDIEEYKELKLEKLEADIGCNDREVEDEV